MKLLHMAFASSLAAAMAILGTDPAQAAFLESKRIQVNWDHELAPFPLISTTGGPVTVGPDVELPNFGNPLSEPPIPPLVDIDFSDTQIRMTLLRDQPPSSREVFSFLDIFQELPPLNEARLNPASNWAGFPANFVSPTHEGITVTVTGFQGLAGQFILIDVVPEPASFGLMATALAGLAAVRRRRP